MIENGRINLESLYDFILRCIEDPNYNNVRKLRSLVKAIKLFTYDEEKTKNLTTIIYNKIITEVKSNDEKLDLILKLASIYQRPKKVDLKNKKDIQL